MKGDSLTLAIAQLKKELAVAAETSKLPISVISLVVNEFAQSVNAAYSQYLQTIEASAQKEKEEEDE